MKKPTEKDLNRFLRLTTKWAKKIGRVGWSIGGTICDCEVKNVLAHGKIYDRAHSLLLYLHDADDLENSALHEAMHLLVAEMSKVVFELRDCGMGEKARQEAYDWYDYYEDRFIDHMVGILLGMDKEIRSLKRKIKKLESQ